ncbi:MAG: FAD:protein FMN transferase [bacterium]
MRHPRAEGLLAELPVRDAAIVTSGDYERFFEIGGRRYHHIIDVRTGLPADRSVAVTVIAPDATRADALATAFFVEGPAAAARAQRLGVQAAILAPDGTITATPGLAALGTRFDVKPPVAEAPSGQPGAGQIHLGPRHGHDP